MGYAPAVADWGTVVLGLAGIAGTVAGSWYGARSQRLMAREERENAHKVWLRDRRADTYVDLIDVLVPSDASETRNQAEERLRLTGRLAAFGSVRIGELYAQWLKTSPLSDAAVNIAIEIRHHVQEELGTDTN
jgi:hypothetical protein